MITPTEAAEILDITVEDLLYSRARGLPPGNMGYNVVVDGEILLFFRLHDLLPPPPSQIATTPTEWGPGDEQTEIPTNEAVNPSRASDSTSSKDVYFRLDDSDSLDRSGSIWDPPKDTRTRAQLVEDAEGYGISVPKSWSKGQIREAILEAEKAEEAWLESEGIDPDDWEV